MMIDNISKKPTNNSWLRGTAVFFLILTLATIIGRMILYMNPCGLIAPMNTEDWGIFFLGGPGFAILGMLITFYQPANRIAWLCLVNGFTLPLLSTVFAYIDCGLQSEPLWIMVPYAAWLNYAVISPIVISAMFILLPMLFPSGRFVSPFWRNAALVIFGFIFLLNFGAIFVEDFTVSNAVGFTYPLENPFGLLSIEIAAVTNQIMAFLEITAALLAIGSIIVRFRQSQGDERQQIKWFAYFLGTAVFIQIFFFEFLAFNYLRAESALAQTTIGRGINVAYGLVLLVVLAGFPITIGLAIFRYRLYDIDIIIRRTVQYAAVSAVLVATYYGSVVLLQTVFTSQMGEQSPLIIVISTLVTAALFNPLRTRLQTFIDRRFYRQKYNAEQILSNFAQTARDEVELESLTHELAHVVQETMQPESISVWLKR